MAKYGTLKLAKLLCISTAGIVLFVLLAIQPLALAQTPKGDDPVVGRWRWRDKQVVECYADNSFSVLPTNRKGLWRILPAKTVERKYEFIWDKGRFVDTLTMSRDQKKLTGE